MAISLKGNRLGKAAAAENADVHAMIADHQNEALTPGTRQWMIEEIKRLSPDDFTAWYDETYKLRASGKQEEYEAKIKAKYTELTSKQLAHRPNERVVCIEEDEDSNHIRNFLARRKTRDLPFELEGTYPSPQIVGGEVVEFQPYKFALIDDIDNVPF